MQKLKVIARTFEVKEDSKSGNCYRVITEDTVRGDAILSDMTTFGGKMAGICYMPDDYLSDGIQDVERASKRANGNKKSGHYSVFEHGQITFLLETNKMMAMILNSLNVYATSEKSARYTVMKPETKNEDDKYNKWTYLFSKIIDGYYSFAAEDNFLNLNKSCTKDHTSVNKLAQENARYMLSIFTPTVMSYTVSFKQAIMIGQWLHNLAKECSLRFNINPIYQLDNYCEELSVLILDAVGVNINDLPLIDHKGQYIRFISNISSKTGSDKKEHIADSYTLRYECSLACLAQAERHRSIRYSFDAYSLIHKKYYIPEIIKGTPYEKEWIKDLNKYDKNMIPQALLVDVTEQGIFEDFYLKCLERLCSRAQLEIQRLTEESVMKFKNNTEYLSRQNVAKLCGMFNNDKLTPRCQFEGYTCKEPCSYGASGLCRNI